MKHFRALALSLGIGILFAAGITFAAWQGTTWISSGAVIDATKIKDNFDYLYGLWTLPDANTIQTTRNVSAPAFVYSSDRTLKTNITSLSSAQDILLVEPKRFNWKQTGIDDVGIIAQDVEAVFPEFVQTNEQGTKSVDYAKLVVPLLGVVRNQQKEIETLKARLDAAGI